MKSFLALISLLLLFVFDSSTTNAQLINNNNGLKNRFCLKASFNFATPFANDVYNTKSNARFDVGLFAKLPITSFIFIKPVLYYTTKVTDLTYGNILANGTTLFNLNYIELPVLFTVNINKYSKDSTRLYAAFLVNEKVNNLFNVSLFNFKDNIDKLDFKEIDFGLTAGLNVGSDSLGKGAKYKSESITVDKEKSIENDTFAFLDAKNEVSNIHRPFVEFISCF